MGVKLVVRKNGTREFRESRLCMHSPFRVMAEEKKRKQISALRASVATTTWTVHSSTVAQRHHKPSCGTQKSFCSIGMSEFRKTEFSPYDDLACAISNEEFDMKDFNDRWRTRNINKFHEIHNKNAAEKLITNRRCYNLFFDAQPKQNSNEKKKKTKSATRNSLKVCKAAKCSLSFERGVC